MKIALYLIIATALWGLNFHLAKVMLQYTPAMEAGFWRYLFGVVVLFAFCLKDFPKWFSVKSNVKPLVLVGVIGLFGFNFFLFIGMQYTTAINTALIVSLNPALTLIFSILLLKTKITIEQIAGIVIAFIGALLLITKGHLGNIGQLVFSKGDLYVILANTIFSLHHVFVKKYSGRMSTMHFTFLTNSMCLLAFALIMPFQHIGNFTQYPYQFWLSAIGIGAFGTALAYYFWNKGVAVIGAAQAGIYMNIAPLTTVLFSFFFGEQLLLYHVISGVIIIIGLLVMRLKLFPIKSS